MPSNWSRRRLLQVGSFSAVVGLSGCTSLPFVGTLGFVLRNYTSEAHNAHIEIQLYGRTTFEQTYQLSPAQGGKPHVRIETDAVSSIPAGVTYSVSVSLDGREAESINATMDCTSREGQQVDEELDINIGFGNSRGVQIWETSC